MYLQWNAGSLNVNSFAFHVIKTLLQIVEAFQEPYYSHDTSLISIMYAKPDTFDSEDNVACSFLNLQIMHVLQYSRCLHSIKHLTKPNQNKTKQNKTIQQHLWIQPGLRMSFAASPTTGLQVRQATTTGERLRNPAYLPRGRFLVPEKSGHTAAAPATAPGRPPAVSAASQASSLQKGPEAPLLPGPSTAGGQAADLQGTRP